MSSVDGKAVAHDDLTPLQRAALAMKEMRSRLDAAERTHSEPIAVIGIGCRFPGGITDPDSFWRLLDDGVDAIAEIPPQRWDIDAYFDPRPATPGKMYVRHGGFIENIDQFDADFFGISPREAASLDPQQRLLLEVSWEALERAGYPPIGEQRSTGVFVGITTTDYGQKMLMSHQLADIDLYYGGGNSLHTAAGRIAYILGLQGPAMALDTACSSSLVSVHLAAQSLRKRECDVALAGGVNLMLAPQWTVIICQSQMLAADGRCKTFDEAADGYVRSEGCGMLVLKRLSDAIADRDDIVAVIQGSAVSHGGASSGLTVPNGPAQQRVIRAALDAAKANPADVDYVEAHGTGTSLGDPIEVAALAEVFSNSRANDRPLHVGAVKTNIGHLESAAGVAGLIKTILALRHKSIPAHLHFDTPNPYIAWDQINLRVPVTATAWPAREDGKPRVAGVSSFGVSGVNAHVVITEAPPREPTQPQSSDELQLLPIAAARTSALRDLAQDYHGFLDHEGPANVGEICFTAATGRVHSSIRAVAIGATRDALKTDLDTVITRLAGAADAAGTATPGQPPRIAFLFSGQGAQYAGMGRELYASETVYRNALDRCAEVLDPHLDQPLLSVLHARTDSAAATLLNRTAFTQPALFALEYALCELWQSWGIYPSAVLGHSVGEYAAACVAGVFSVEDGLRLMVERGRLMQAQPETGSMRAVMAGAEQTRAAIAPFSDVVAIAAVNGPDNTVISGQREAIDAIARALGREGVKSRELVVSHAFHSPLMDPILDEFEQTVAGLTLSPPRLPFISNVTGNSISGERVTQPEYWRSHIRQPVLFADSVTAALQQQCAVFVEIGPGGTLLGMAQNCAPRGTARASYYPSLREGRDDVRQVFETLGKLYVDGAAVDWRGFYRHRPDSQRRIALPTYAFQRERHWMTEDSDTASTDIREAAADPRTTALDVFGDGEMLAAEMRNDGSLDPADAAALPRVLAALQARLQTRQSEELARAWMYEQRWEETSPDATPPPAQGLWVICGDTGHVVTELGQAMTASDTPHTRCDPDAFSADPAAVGQDLQRICADKNTRLQAVVYLCNPDACAFEQQPAADSNTLLTTLERSFAPLITLARALQGLTEQPTARLYVVTRGAVATDPESDRSVAPNQTALWGMARALAVECPEIWGGIVDLPPTPDADENNAMWPALRRSDEDQIAIRGRRQFAPRIVRRTATAAAGPELRNDGTYLITGGLGGIGLEIARWFVTRGRNKVVLLGRSGASAAAQTVIADLEAHGAEIIVAAADTANFAELSAVIEDAERRLGPLRGVVHAAGITDNGLLRDQTWERFATVFTPKVLGGWNLHCLTRERDLDCFVSLSSTAALLGHDGQSNYAAANAYLDGLTHLRRGLQLPATSLDFGPWRQIGMAAGEGLDAHFSARGLARMDSRHALAAFALALDEDANQLGVVDCDWSAVIAQYPGGRVPSHLLALGSAPASGIAPATREPRLTVAELAAKPRDERAALLLDYAVELVVRTLGHNDGAALDTERPLLELGLDSLMAMQLRNAYLDDFDLAVPLNVFLEGGSVQQVNEAVLAEIDATADHPTTVAAEAANGATIAPEKASELLDKLDDLSDDEVDALLGKMLEDSGPAQ